VRENLIFTEIPLKEKYKTSEITVKIIENFITVQLKLTNIGKNMIFWRKIVIFHTKYPKNVRASLRNWKKYDFLT
jgi:hypothetical protein